MTIKSVVMNVCIIIFLLSITTSCILRDNSGQITLINESGESIKTVRIEVCKQLIEFKTIRQGEKAKGTYKITSDSHYDILVTFASGKKLRKQLGYVTNGFDFQHTLVVKDADIIIIDSKEQLEGQKSKSGLKSGAGPR